MQMNEGFLLTVFLVVAIATVLFYNASPVPSDCALPIQPDDFNKDALDYKNQKFDAVEIIGYTPAPFKNGFQPIVRKLDGY